MTSALAFVLASAAAAVPLPEGWTMPLTLAEQDAVFTAAGFQYDEDREAWVACGDDPGTASYVPGQIEQVVDLNGDKRPEAIVTESSEFCYGSPFVSYSVVSKGPTGAWAKVADGTGMVGVLATKGPGGWADIESGGPGFCFPVLRWNGTTYKVHRYEYEGKPCKR